jgi:serine/threonine protein kinase
MLGTLLRDRYEVFYHLGGGGFGQTYLARDTTTPTHEWLLVKQLKPFVSPLFVSDLEKAKELFSREIEVLKDLGQHDRIPSLLDFFIEAEESYLVQEFIDGRVLSQELKEKLEFSEIQVLMFLKNVLEVLSFVHSKGIIHRDIKPPNLIRRRQDHQLVLIDFGAVKQLAPPESIRGTGTRIVTDIYTPREQERGKPKLCSDIYALGIVAIQAFIGAMPSIDEDTNEIDWQSQKQTSSDFAELINKMICEKPVERYASADQALDVVNKIIDQFEPEIREEASKNPTPSKFDYINFWYVEANKLRDIYRHHRSAIYLYDKVIQIEPSFWKAWFNRGITLRYLKRHEESVRSFEKAIQINSKSPSIHFHKGISLAESENFIEALESYNRALEIHPLYSIVYFHKGITLYRLGRCDEAVEAYEEAKKLRPSFGKFSIPAIC